MQMAGRAHQAGAGELKVLAEVGWVTVAPVVLLKFLPLWL